MWVCIEFIKLFMIIVITQQPHHQKHIECCYYCRSQSFADIMVADLFIMIVILIACNIVEVLYINTFVVNWILSIYYCCFCLFDVVELYSMMLKLLIKDNSLVLSILTWLIERWLRVWEIEGELECIINMEKLRKKTKQWSHKDWWWEILKH